MTELPANHVTGVVVAPSHPASEKRKVTGGLRSSLSAGVGTGVSAMATAGAAALVGLVLALVMPRGPVTPAQALATMLLGLAIGLSAGFLMRSRWAMCLAPAAHVAAFELGRLGAVGPTVDAIRLDGMFSILALLSGRGVHAVLGLLPMVVGASVGAALARRLNGRAVRERGTLGRVWLSIRRATTAIVFSALVVLSVAIVQPGSTSPILGPDGHPLSGSIATLEAVQIGGHEQWLSIRGHSVDNPVLLHLAGGPGDSDIGDTSRTAFSELVQDFTVVIWDQRGTGKSYPALEPTVTHTLDQAVADTIEVTNYLRTRFDEQKIYLMGNSWGSTLGVLAVQRAPELYHAYIGSGQMVSERETDRLIYQDIMAYADRAGDTDLAATMQAYGEPVYKDILAYAFVMGYYEKLTPYDPPQEYFERKSVANTGFMGTGASEYTLLEKVNLVRGIIDGFGVMYPQLQNLDFRRDVRRLEVPVYILAGRYELRGRAALLPEWLDQLEAPHKLLVTFENAAHAPHAEEAPRFHRLMTEVVLSETYPGH